MCKALAFTTYKHLNMWFFIDFRYVRDILGLWIINVKKFEIVDQLITGNVLHFDKITTTNVLFLF